MSESIGAVNANVGQGRLRSSSNTKIDEFLTIGLQRYEKKHFGNLDSAKESQKVDEELETEMHGDAGIENCQINTTLSSHESERRELPVEVLVYDVSKPMCQVFDGFLPGNNFEILYHTGILYAEREYWYTGYAFCSGQTPFRKAFGEPLRELGDIHFTESKQLEGIMTMSLGTSTKTPKEVQEFLFEKLATKYSRSKYDAFEHSCNYFSQDLAEFLTGTPGIPEYIVDPQGRYKNAQCDEEGRSALNECLMVHCEKAVEKSPPAEPEDPQATIAWRFDEEEGEMHYPEGNEVPLTVYLMK